MESTAPGRSAAAVDGDGRRFPDPPPPHGRDTDSALPDMAALVFRREQLLQELHRERIRHDMIMCELAETERVMTACLAGRGAWCGRPLMTPWEETMYRTPRSSEETSWWHGNPSGPEIAPVYPRVERSPSPPVLQPQLQPVDNAQKEECGRSLAVAPSAPPDVEQFPSLSKQPVVEEVLVPAATNVVAKPAQLLSSKEVTLESRGDVDHEHEVGLNDRHVVPLMQSKTQIGEELKRASVGQEHKAEAKDTLAVQLMDCAVQRSELPMHAAIGQECRAEAKDSHAMKLMKCEIKRGEQLKRAEVGQERQVCMNIRHALQVMESKFRRNEQVKLEAVDQKQETEVKNHEVQLMESEIHRSEQPKREAFGQEHEAEEKDRHAGQLPKISEEPKPGDATIKDHTDDERRRLPHQYKLAGKENPPPSEQKRLVSSNEPNTQITPSGVKENQMLGPIVETPAPKRHKPSEEWSCTHCQVNLSCEEDLRRHQEGGLHRLIIAAWQSKQEAAELTAKSTPESAYCAPQGISGLVRPVLAKSTPESSYCAPRGIRGLVRPVLAKSTPESAYRAPRGIRGMVRPVLPDNMEKREPQKAKWDSPFDIRNQNSLAMHTEECGKEGSKRAAERTCTEDPKKKFVAERRWPFCHVCKVQCNSEKMMQSHLGGKKHRENLQARH